jgi:hypothetical protein
MLRVRYRNTGKCGCGVYFAVGLDRVWRFISFRFLLLVLGLGGVCWRRRLSGYDYPD